MVNVKSKKKIYNIIWKLNCLIAFMNDKNVCDISSAKHIPSDYDRQL